MNTSRPTIQASLLLLPLTFKYRPALTLEMAEFTIQDEDLASLKGKVAVVTGIQPHEQDRLEI